MKTLIILACLSFSISSFAHQIEGTLVLKGRARTKVMIGNTEMNCTVNIKNVENYDDQDDFGNPVYQIETDIRISSLDRTHLNQSARLINIFNENGQKITKDHEYISQDNNIRLFVDRDGRLKDLVINSVSGRKTTCRF